MQTFYYSRFSNLKIFRQGDGKPPVEFSPMGQSAANAKWGGPNWGHFQTEDQELIGFLEARRASQGENPDILNQEEFNAALAQESGSSVKLLAEQSSELRKKNAVLAALQEQGVIDAEGNLINAGKKPATPQVKPDNKPVTPPVNPDNK
jgi:hypothetical protein